MVKTIIALIRRSLRKQFNVMPDLDDEENTIAQIKKGVSFHGANLWVLVFAIFIASLGLNVNSTAVIIGAMLISPLMGPIIGIGLSIGIMDFELLRRSARNFVISTVISVFTATIYFLLTPIADAQSELLARTSPTLYDVLIALFGGAAGILGLATGGKGNVIPGVAIATALMPPLCTAGYGLATGNATFFFGAFYLYFINTVFISLATFIGVRMMQFKQIEIDEKNRVQQMPRYIWSIVIATLLPAAYMTVGIVQDSLQQNNMNHFVKNELQQDGVQILSTRINEEDNTINIVALGKKIDSTAITKANNKLKDYHLNDFKLKVIQGTTSDSLLIANAATANTLIASSQQEREQLLAQIASLQVKEEELKDYKKWESLTQEIAKEAKVLFPQIADISIARLVTAQTETNVLTPCVCAMVTLKQKTKMSTGDTNKLHQWLQSRCKDDALKIVMNR